jgi:uncharacterized phage protein gp47/JayE
MSSFGVTTEGFVEKTFEELLDEIEQAQRAAFGPAINTQADSVLGQINGIITDKLAELWEVALAVYRARQPDSANGEALDNVGAITGATRLQALPSSATVFVNLDDGTTLPSGSVMSIGAAGARWTTVGAVNNALGWQGTFPVDIQSEENAPVVGNAFSIDTIAVPVSGWTAKAAKTTLNQEPFLLADGQTLLVEIDEGDVQVVSFAGGDFANIAAATAQEVADAITADLTNAEAVDAGGMVRLVSDKEGSGSAVRIRGGTAAESLAFTRELFRGFNPDVSAKLQSQNSEAFALADSEDLFVKVDQGITQTITFTDELFALQATGSLATIAAVLHAVGVDTDTFILDDGVNPAVTFIFDDDGSVVEDAVTRAVNHTGAETADQMRDLIILAIAGAPLLDITASNGGPGVVTLINDNIGTAGNQAIVETVGDVGFVASGMAGGTNTTIGSASAIAVAKAINTQLLDAVAYEVLGRVQIESLVAGANSFVEVTGGSANAELGFVESLEIGGVSGDALLGRDVEEDAAFRLRREQLLRITGAATVESIRAAVRAIENPDVLQAFVFENPTDAVDGFGRPPHSFEAVVVGGDDQAIGEVIFAVKPIGIETFKVPGVNGVTVQVFDSQNISHDINFSRANDIQHHIEIDITVDQVAFGGGNQSAGEQQVREALKARGDALQIGEDVVIIQFACAALDVAGVIDVTVTRIEDTDPPLNTSNIVIGDRDFATFSTADIDVNTTFA